MDFFSQEQRAQKQTRRLLWLFGLMVLLAMAIEFIVLGAVLQSFRKALPHEGSPPGFFAPLLVPAEMLMAPGDFLRWICDPKLALWIFPLLALSIIAGCLYKIRQLASGGPAVAELLGGRGVAPHTKDARERHLRNVVEEMAIASGMPVPEVYILDRERGLNTFAAGHTREDVAIGVTFAAMQLLTREELQGAIAHEFSHILNGDTRLNMKLMGLAHGLIWPTIAGRVLLRGNSDDAEVGESIFDEDSSPLRLPFVPIAIPLLILGAIGSPFVRFMKSSICREREWLADASAVQFTRSPTGIEGALKKVGGLLKQGRLDTGHAEAASHFYLVNCRHESWFGFQSTHPPLEKRILAIDPQFDGQFQHIRSLPSRDAENDRTYAEAVLRAQAEAQADETKDGS